MSSTVRLAAQTIHELLEIAGVPWRSLRALASVQPRRWVPSAIADTLGGGVPAPDTFTELAHVGGCGVLTNLIEARRRGALTPGALAVLYAQGAGFTRGAALVRF
jgi:3-oxoacyl-[acyl-carrier-protein] synthase III